MVVVTTTRTTAVVKHDVIITTTSELDRDVVLQQGPFLVESANSHVFYCEHAEVLVRPRQTLSCQLWRGGLQAAIGLAVGLALGILLGEPRGGALSGCVGAGLSSWLLPHLLRAAH